MIRYRKLGDALMATPILCALHDAGRFETFTVTEAANATVFSRLPGVAGGLSLSEAQPSRLEIVRAGLRARRFRADVALVLTFKRRAALFARLAGCASRYGAANRAKDFASLTHNAYDPKGWENLHQVERYYAVAEAMAGSLPRLPTVFRVPEAERKAADARLGGLPEGYAVVHLGGGGSNVGPDDATYSRIVAGLRGKGIPVLVAGGPDAAGFPAARAAADRDLVGKTDLDALAELDRRADVVVAPDGGGPRIAAAVGTPVVCVSLSLRWARSQVAPWMVPSEVVEPRSHCSGCAVHRCDKRGRTCVETLDPARVVEAALRLRNGVRAV